MGGKTSKSTQTVSIPPEVLARYNAVNARAEQVAGTPFQPYSYNPADFVAQLTPTQLAGIQNVNLREDSVAARLKAEDSASAVARVEGALAGEQFVIGQARREHDPRSV